MEFSRSLMGFCRSLMLWVGQVSIFRLIYRTCQVVVVVGGQVEHVVSLCSTYPRPQYVQVSCRTCCVGLVVCCSLRTGLRPSESRLFQWVMVFVVNRGVRTHDLCPASMVAAVFKADSRVPLKGLGRVEEPWQRLRWR